MLSAATPYPEISVECGLNDNPTDEESKYMSKRSISSTQLIGVEAFHRSIIPPVRIGKFEWDVVFFMDHKFHHTCYFNKFFFFKLIKLTR